MSLKRKKLNDADEGLYYKSPSGWYSLLLPHDWVVNENDGFSEFQNPNIGVGSLQISAYSIPSEQNTKALLSEHIAENLEGGKVKKIVTEVISTYACSSTEYLNQTWYYNVFVLSDGNYLLFITYICKLQFRGSESKELKRIVNSIRFLD